MQRHVFAEGPEPMLLRSEDLDDADDEPDRLSVLEAKLAAVEALASKANVTAQEVAAAVKNAKPPDR